MKKQPKSIGAKRAPNELAGVVVATETGTDHWAGTIYSRMTVAWEHGGTSEHIPMTVIARPGDRFIFTIRPE